jgi:hypothetical protein
MTDTSQNCIYEDTATTFNPGNSSYIHFTIFYPPGIKYKLKYDFTSYFVWINNTACSFSTRITVISTVHRRLRPKYSSNSRSKEGSFAETMMEITRFQVLAAMLLNIYILWELGLGDW